MTKYETGRWHNWDGKSECPFDQNTTDYWIACFDTSYGGYFNVNPSAGIKQYKGSSPFLGHWKHRNISPQNVIAFYIVSYKDDPKEMTVQQVEEALGYPVKIVK